jgi:DNA-binding transcriptional LysR family regulator
MPMDLVRQFQNVLTVIEKGSLGKAAETLHISQPALTKGLRRLEEQLGVPLFYRDSKGMRPTIYGEALRAHAQEITVSVSQALREIDALRVGSEGVIRVAAGPLVTSEILSQAVVALMRKHPALRVNIHTEIGDRHAGLREGKHDFILTLLPLGEPEEGLQQRAIFNDRIAVIARRNHPLTRSKRVSIAQLAAASWVMPVAGHYHRRRLESVFEAEHLPIPDPVVECSSTEFMKSMVAQTDHLGLVAHMGVGEMSASSNVVEIPIASPFLVRPIGIVWRKHHILSKSSRMLIDAIETVCAAMQDRAAANMFHVPRTAKRTAAGARRILK